MKSTADSVKKCAWCELDLDPADRQSIRLSNTQPPWSARSAFGATGAIIAAGEAFASSLRAMRSEPVITLWFHRPCWDDLLALLRGR